MRAKRVVRLLVLGSIVGGASGLLLRGQDAKGVVTLQLLEEKAENRYSAASDVLPDGRTLIAGGDAEDGTPTDTVVLYDPVSNSFALLGHLLAPRVGHTATLLADGRVLIAGGSINGEITSDLEIFTPGDGV